MTILIVTPAPEGSLSGNRWTALRWADVLSNLGHAAWVAEHYDGRPCDLMVALHARRSAPAIARCRAERPSRPLVVALTGTDLYRDLPHDARAVRSVQLADRLIVLQPLAAEVLEPEHRAKVRVILQSTVRSPDAPAVDDDRFEICVSGHLRPVKDPFRAAEAVTLLPPESRVRVTQVGAALQPEMERRALAEQASNPRYRWLGPLPRDEALRVMARCRLLVLSSFMEGGANVIGEAVVHGVPVIASRIPGSIGLLGADYPGYFPAGDTAELAALIGRCERDGAFLDDLRRRCAALAEDFAPARELAAWRRLIAELLP